MPERDRIRDRMTARWGNSVGVREGWLAMFAAAIAAGKDTDRAAVIADAGMDEYGERFPNIRNQGGQP